MFFKYFSVFKDSSDYVCPIDETRSLVVNSTLSSTGNDVIEVDKWDPPKIAGIPVYIWPYVIVGLWHFVTATGVTLYSGVSYSNNLALKWNVQTPTHTQGLIKVFVGSRHFSYLQSKKKVYDFIHFF